MNHPPAKEMAEAAALSAANITVWSMQDTATALAIALSAASLVWVAIQIIWHQRKEKRARLEQEIAEEVLCQMRRKQGDCPMTIKPPATRKPAAVPPTDEVKP